MVGFKKWCSLNQFHEVNKNLNYPRIYAALKSMNFKVRYGLKVKLHGTNSCVRIEPDGAVIGQKRSGDVRVGNDNHGFAAWVAEHESYFSGLADSELTTYIYGEWCGPGVKSGVACSMTENKFFYPFSIEYWKGSQFMERVYDPNTIEHNLEQFGYMPSTMLVVPYIDTIELDFQNKSSLEIELLKLNKRVEEIGERDPFMYSIFEIEGPGEGIVAYPLIGNEVAYEGQKEAEFFSWFNFKAKSEAHRVNKTKTAANFDPEKFANANRFADAYCTNQRMEQGFSEALQCRKDIRLMSDFIKWVVSDIFKESHTEREASPELDWKALSKVCTTRAAIWYKNKVQEI